LRAKKLMEAARLIESVNSHFGAPWRGKPETDFGGRGVSQEMRVGVPVLRRKRRTGAGRSFRSSRSVRRCEEIGYGYELSPLGIHEFVNIKTIWVS
jgi:hypothetical protein